MDGVRLVARLLGVTSWIVLVLSAVAVLALGVSLSRLANAPFGMLVVVPALIGLVLASGGLFFSWALLTGVGELHAQGERLLDTISNLELGLANEEAPASVPGRTPRPATAAERLNWSEPGARLPPGST